MMLVRLMMKMYSSNASTRSISELMGQIFDCKYSATSESNITNEVIDQVKAFKERKLERDYFVIYIDCLFAIIRIDTVKKEAIYFILGVNTSGYIDYSDFTYMKQKLLISGMKYL